MKKKLTIPPSMQQRLKNPYFLMAMLAFMYQLLTHLEINIDETLWNMGADLLSYVLIGAGIYKTFPAPPSNEPDPPKEEE